MVLDLVLYFFADLGLVVVLEICSAVVEGTGVEICKLSGFVKSNLAIRV